MNIKKLTAVLLAVLLLASVLTGCSGASKDLAMDYESSESPVVNGNSGALEDGIYDSSTADKVPVVTDRKLIRTISLNAETEDLDTLLSALDSKVATLGGYMEKRDVYTGSRYSSNAASRNARLTVRIPKDKIDEFVAHVGNESNVTSSNESSDDVTLSYVAVQSRMTALQKEEERLLALIDQAANLSELLELEQRLTEVRTELENVTSQLLVYDNLVDYGTVHISIQEVQKLTPTVEPGFWTRLTNSFTDSVCELWSFLKELTILTVAAAPWLLTLTAPFIVVLLIVLLIVRKNRKTKVKKESPFKTDDKK